MGFHSYLCIGCNKGLSFNGFEGEQVVLKHIRHGELLEMIQGEYDGYGQVLHDSWESTKEVLRSQWCFTDSVDFNKKDYQGQLIDWIEYRILKAKEKGIDMVPGDKHWVSGKDLTPEIQYEWGNLPKVTVDNPRSGIEAWHRTCHDSAKKELLKAHFVSKTDPYQGTR